MPRAIRQQEAPKRGTYQSAYQSAKPPPLKKEPEEWEHRQQRGLVNNRCACGRIAEYGYVCSLCRISNEPED